MWTIQGHEAFENAQGHVGRHCPPLPQAMSIKNKRVLKMEVPSTQDLQKWAQQSQSSKDYKQLTLATFEAALQWPAKTRVNVKWKPLSVLSDMERKSSICLRVRQISASPAGAPLSDVPKVVQSLYQLTNSIQKQNSPHLRPFVKGDDKLQAMLTLKEKKSVEIRLNQITGLILDFFIGNTSSLTDLGQEYTSAFLGLGVLRVRQHQSRCPGVSP